MKRRSHVVCVRVYPLAIPLRKPFGHAAHTRPTADPVVIQVELADGTVGSGETLPRPYVSGETVESVVATIRDPMLNLMLDLSPASFPEALERIAALPTHNESGTVIIAARAGVELALLDAYSRHFRKPISHVVGWLGLPGLGPPGSIRAVRYSGVLSGDEPARFKRSVRLMRWFGLRDFKLKVGFQDDMERVGAVVAALGSALGKKLTLRLDANGAWTLEQALERLSAWNALPLECVEQPLPRGHEHDLLALKQAVSVPIMHDESLVTFEDAERLVRMGVADAFNIRIGKNGGFLPALRLAHLARRSGIRYQLGCMVGETSILSAVGRRFLENVPGVAFAEGSYGRFLLSGDVVDRPVRFGWGGKARPLPGPGWGAEVRTDLLERFTCGRALTFPV